MSKFIPRTLANQLVIKPKLENLVEVQRFVQAHLAPANPPADFLRQMKLVVDESVTNAIDHGAANTGVGEVRISVEIVDDSFQMIVEDFHGRLFDPEYFQRIAMVRDWGKGGRGILLIHGYMDHVSYLIEEGKHTLLYMEKKIPRPAPAAQS